MHFYDQCIYFLLFWVNFLANEQNDHEIVPIAGLKSTLIA